VRTDIHGRSRIYSAWPVDITPQIPELAAAGVTRFMADCSLLDANQTARAVTRIVRALDAYRSGTRPAEKEPNTTSGHLFSGIG
jgi:putative protease